MKISIVIPVVNEASAIVDSVERAWIAGGDEVIVVDGGSTDGTLELLAPLRCQVLRSPAGRGRQMNEGANRAGGDLLLFLHADCWLPTGACDQIRELGNPSHGLWGGFEQRIDHGAAKYRWLERGNAWRVRWRRLVYGDQALFVSKCMFESLGGFPDLPLMEDLELSRRLGQPGRRERPHLLLGPVHVSARRWEENGVMRQTLKNWLLAAAYRWGWSAEELARRYRRHDDAKS